MKKAVLRETDLYAPVRDWLIGLGYTVRGEVLGCDLAAQKDDELILIELKRQCSLELLIQATRRQKVTDSVYVAIPRPDDCRGKRWKGTLHLLRRLELGLILVSFTGKRARIEMVCHPIPFTRQKRKSAHRAVLKEIAGRSQDLNVGGSTRRKLMTAYRENALRLACWLDRLGPQTPKALRDLGGSPKTQTILYDNVYGWFERVDRGVYGLTAAGKEGVNVYPELSEQFAEELALGTDK